MPTSRFFTSRSSSAQLRGDLRDMPPLIPGAFQFDLARLPGTIPAGDGGGAVGGISHDLVDTHLALERIRQPDDHEAKVKQHGVKGKNGRFLPAVLRRTG